jgi:hypothetical protein
VAVLGLLLAGNFSYADDEKADERRTESPSDEGEEQAENDPRAQRLLERAYKRVHSAEASGLERLMAGADIQVDATSMGFGKLDFPGELVWQSGKPAEWRADDGEGAEANPLGQLSDAVRDLFAPYLGYVAGFESWDVRFKDARFAMLEAEVRDEELTLDRVQVTYPDERVEIFFVARNQIMELSREAEVRGQKATLLLAFEYEDQGRRLMPTKVSGSTEFEMDMPGQEERRGQRDTLEGTIEVKRWGKAGEHEIATELAATVRMPSFGLSFPASLKLGNIRVNDEVSDADLKGEAEKAEAEPERETAPGEEDF